MEYNEMVSRCPKAVRDAVAYLQSKGLVIDGVDLQFDDEGNLWHDEGFVDGQIEFFKAGSPNREFGFGNTLMVRFATINDDCPATFKILADNGENIRRDTVEEIYAEYVKCS